MLRTAFHTAAGAAVLSSLSSAFLAGALAQATPSTSTASTAPSRSDSPVAVPAPAQSGGEGPSPDTLAELIPVDGGLTAAAAAQRAASVSPGVARARAAAMLAEQGAARAWVGLLPRLDLSARYTRLSEVPAAGFASVPAGTFDALRAQAASVADPVARELFLVSIASQEATASFRFPVLVNQYGLHAGLVWPVSDLFFQMLPAHRSARRYAEAAQFQARATRDAAAFAASEAFYNFARAKGALGVAVRAVRDAEAHRADIVSFVESGTAARVELMRVDAQLATARVAVARAEGGVAMASEALRALLHLPPGADVSLGEDVTQTPVIILPSREAALSQAIADRNELRAVRRLISSREENLESRAGSRYPRLALSANADYANPNTRIFPQQERFRGTWDVSAVLSWSPNDFLFGTSDVGSAEAELAQARADLGELEDNLRIEVSQAYEGIEAARQAVEAARVAVEAAEESHRVRVERFRAGAAVNSEVVDAESELTRARLDFVNSSIDLHVAHMRLRRATGALLGN